MKTKTMIAALLLMSSLTAMSSENIQFQNIRVGGLGCPSEVTQIATAPDLSSASIIFQSFESHVPAIVRNNKGTPYISNLNCNVFLDLKLPANQKLESIEITYDLRGHAGLDKGVSGNFRSYLMSSNGLGTERSQRNQLLQEKTWFNTSVDQDEDFRIEATKTMSLNSQCGNSGNGLVSVNLQHQVGTQIIGGYERTSAQGTITMDSSDLTGGIKIRATTSLCGSNPNGPLPRQNCRVMRVNGRSQMVCL